MSDTLFLVAGALAIVLAGWAISRNLPRAKAATKPASARPSAATQARVAKGATDRQAAGAGLPVPVVPAAPVAEVPAALATFEWRKVQDLEAAQRTTLLAALKGIPRPPSSLQRLLSPDFVANAGSGELSDLVMTDPLIAARILAVVNTQFYGLRRPVTNIQEAVTFMGMTTVRNICLQYMLADSFKSGKAGSQKTFDAICRSSALASDLSARLGKALNLPKQGILSTQVVLGFVGQLAAASLIPRKNVDEWLKLDRLQRMQKEQELLGLSASEIGAELLKTWQLPADLIEAVQATHRMLVTPPVADPTAESPRLALCYLCSRLGERLATGQMTTLQGYDPLLDVGPDTFYLNQHLGNPMLRQLPAALASAEVQDALAQMMGGAAQTALAA